MGIMDKIKNVEPRTGADTFLGSMVEKLISNLPPDVLNNINTIAETVKGFKAQLDEIQRVQNEILIAQKAIVSAGNGYSGRVEIGVSENNSDTGE